MNSKKFSISFNDTDKSIRVFDLTDAYNDTKAFNRNTRSYKKAKALYEESVKKSEVDGETTFWEVVRLFDTVGMRMHAYCGMD